MTYQEKLKDPRWQKKRLKILERDNWMCQLCGDKDKTLHVHHKSYQRNTDPWNYPNELLVTVCDECHKFIYENYPLFEMELIETVRQYILDPYDVDFLSVAIEKDAKKVVKFCFDIATKKE